MSQGQERPSLEYRIYDYLRTRGPATSTVLTNALNEGLPTDQWVTGNQVINVARRCERVREDHGTLQAIVEEEPQQDAAQPEPEAQQTDSPAEATPTGHQEPASQETAIGDAQPSNESASEPDQSSEQGHQPDQQESSGQQADSKGEAAATTNGESAQSADSVGVAAEQPQQTTQAT